MAPRFHVLTAGFKLPVTTAFFGAADRNQQQQQDPTADGPRPAQRKLSALAIPAMAPGEQHQNQHQSPIQAGGLGGNWESLKDEPTTPTPRTALADKRKSRLGTTRHLSKPVTLKDEERQQVQRSGTLSWSSPTADRGPKKAGFAEFFFAIVDGNMHRYLCQANFQAGDKPLSSIAVANAMCALVSSADRPDAKTLRVTLVEDDEVHLFQDASESVLAEWRDTIESVALRWGLVQKVKLEHEVAYLRKQLGLLWEMCQNGEVPAKVQKRMADVTMDMQFKDDLLADVMARQEMLSERAAQMRSQTRERNDFFLALQEKADDADGDDQGDSDRDEDDDAADVSEDCSEARESEYTEDAERASAVGCESALASVRNSRPSRTSRTSRNRASIQAEPRTAEPTTISVPGTDLFDDSTSKQLDTVGRGFGVLPETDSAQCTTLSPLSDAISPQSNESKRASKRLSGLSFASLERTVLESIAVAVTSQPSVMEREQATRVTEAAECETSTKITPTANLPALPQKAPELPSPTAVAMDAADEPRSDRHTSMHRIQEDDDDIVQWPQSNQNLATRSANGSRDAMARRGSQASKEILTSSQPGSESKLSASINKTADSEYEAPLQRSRRKASIIVKSDLTRASSLNAISIAAAPPSNGIKMKVLSSAFLNLDCEGALSDVPAAGPMSPQAAQQQPVGDIESRADPSATPLPAEPILEAGYAQTKQDTDDKISDTQASVRAPTLAAPVLPSQKSDSSVGESPDSKLGDTNSGKKPITIVLKGGPAVPAPTLTKAPSVANQLAPLLSDPPKAAPILQPAQQEATPLIRETENSSDGGTADIVPSAIQATDAPVLKKAAAPKLPPAPTLPKQQPPAPAAPVLNRTSFIAAVPVLQRAPALAAPVLSSQKSDSSVGESPDSKPGDTNSGKKPITIVLKGGPAVPAPTLAKAPSVANQLAPLLSDPPKAAPILQPAQQETTPLIRETENSSDSGTADIVPSAIQATDAPVLKKAAAPVLQRAPTLPPAPTLAPAPMLPKQQSMVETIQPKQAAAIGDAEKSASADCLASTPAASVLAPGPASRPMSSIGSSREKIKVPPPPPLRPGMVAPQPGIPRSRSGMGSQPSLSGASLHDSQGSIGGGAGPATPK
ncbi:hypothetical protein HK105_206148 [Polyrhizophydium stewartii]|uniref:PH domain-containing protein n=1 Tax=Polyrhizophydium stewartii TaxID=2732419 RepID=A0ABR4N4A8_9FUNG